MMGLSKSHQKMAHFSCFLSKRLPPCLIGGDCTSSKLAKCCQLGENRSLKGLLEKGSNGKKLQALHKDVLSILCIVFLPTDSELYNVPADGRCGIFLKHQTQSFLGDCN